MYAGIATRTPSQTTEFWVTALRECNIPCMPVRDISDILDDPHLQESGFINERQHPTEGQYYEMREASRYSDWSPAEPTPAPHVGEHSKEFKTRYSAD